MEKLYEIMGNLSEIEYGMESLSSFLKSLEEFYEYKQNDCKIPMERQNTHNSFIKY